MRIYALPSLLFVVSCGPPLVGEDIYTAPSEFVPRAANEPLTSKTVREPAQRLTATQRLEEGQLELGVVRLAPGEVVVASPHGYELATLTIENGVAILDGDIALGDAHTFFGADRTPQNSLIEIQKPWPCGTFFYRFDDSAGNELSAEAKTNVRFAVASIWGLTALRPVELEDLPPADFSYINVKRWDNSWGQSNAIGHKGGMQEIRIPNTFSRGGIIHEFGHALGLRHEHQRFDRDNHITYNESCVDPTKTGNFRMVSTGASGAYDFDSIMHYSSTSFCIKNATKSCICNPITLKPGAVCNLATCDVTTGIISPNRTTLSPGDIAGLRTINENTLPDVTSSSYEGFATSIAVGDFNGDGFEDAAIGISSMDTTTKNNIGGVEIFYGQPEGLMACETLTQAETAVAESGDGFGAALAVGRFDSDGFDDLVIGSPWENVGSISDAGAITIYLGSADGMIAEDTYHQGQFSFLNEASDRFGYALATGDFNDDGLDEIAVGIPGEASGSGPSEGYVMIIERNWFDGWRRFDLVHQNEVAEVQIPGNGGIWNPSPLGDGNYFEMFGSTLAAGDMNNDGHDDLVVGAPGDYVDGNLSGGVYLYQGRDNHMAPWIRLDQRTLGTNELNDSFGKGIGIIDYDNDGYRDLLVGAPGESRNGVNNAGAVFMFRTVGNGIYDDSLMSQTGSGIELHDNFGSEIVTRELPFPRFSVGSRRERIGSNNPRTGASFHYLVGPAGPIGQSYTSPVGVDSLLGEDRYGDALGLIDVDGLAVISGARNHNTGRGAAYLSRREGNSWHHLQILRKGNAYPY